MKGKSGKTPWDIGNSGYKRGLQPTNCGSEAFNNVGVRLAGKPKIRFFHPYQLLFP